MSAEAPRYRFGPRSTRGLIAGWSGGQVVSVGLSALLALGFLRTIGGGAGVLLALVTLAAGVAVARLPVAGRPIESWVPTVARYASSSLGEGRVPWQPRARLKRRGPLSHLEVRSYPGGGVVVDTETATFSAVISAGGDGYALRDEEAQADHVASWAQVLSGLAAEAGDIRRLQWIVRRRPAGSLGWLERPPGPGPLASSYEDLISVRREDLCERETLLVLTAGLTRAPAGPTSRRQSEEAVAERLFSSVAGLVGQLRSAGLDAEGPLQEDALSLTIRRAYEESASPGVGAWPFPLGVEADWDRLRTDESWQVTYWVSEWPRSAVGPGAFLPVLLGGAARQTFSVTLAPLPPGTAVRRAERERTSGQADAELRSRHGFSLTARARAEQEIASSKEAELAAGHGAFSFSGYVSVTAGDEAELLLACAEVERAAGLSQLELRRLYGAQEEGWACTLPTGRGCR